MSSSTKKKLLQNTTAVDIGCSCGRPKFSNLFFPKLRSRISSNTSSSSSSSTTRIPKPDPYTSSTSSLGPNSNSFSPSLEYDATTTTFDTTPFQSESEYTSKTPKSSNKIGESIAVEKDSTDPYIDFRHSMLQMILEKEIYSKEELKELLECFLSLNSPYHHEIIVRAFTEIWNGVFSMGQGFSAVSSRVRRKSRDF
ncbi:hypothetical protein ACHQM5_021021 [Ranunculus cassubicifolius]